MKIRFKNPFLAFWGTFWGVLNIFYPTLLGSFMFGLCFGFIYLNFKEEKNGNK